jgi:ATP-dependent DNA ligase
MSRNSRGRPINAPLSFIHPCQPAVAPKPPVGPGWVHELKHDGYRLQIHVRDGRVRLYTMNGNDWTKRYPRIVEEAARLRAPLIIDAEVVHCQPMALQISTLCIAAPPMRMPWLWLSIFFSRAMISGASH